MSPNAKQEEPQPAVVCSKLDELREGAEVKGDCGQANDQPPPWLDKERFSRAREIFKNHFFSIFFSHLAGLMLIVHMPSMTEPLMSTGNSSNIVCLFRRYLSTLVHIRRWYEGDIFDPKDPAHQSITMVRGMHKRVADKLNGPCRRRCMAVSQYDMALTQFAFIGLIALHPKHVGLHCSQYDLECLIHFWRGIGYMLGVEDRYNLCSGSVDDTVAICRKIMEAELKPSVRNSTKESTTMSQGIIKAMNSFIIFLSWEAMARFWFEQMGLACNFKMGIYESTGYWLMRFTFGGLLKFRLFHKFFNFLLRIAVKVALDNKEYYEAYLTRKHKLTDV
ncbi:uncharacterized protein [Parasteatoda tepidariorum]|uniref:uncharacterized protein n=1 Tax=Parasteatoda tepidariorum TaxID=114398 RepID=UPI00077FA04F|nr:uncharacterized protein LOC107453449 [Parasteatoda tepidariorum]XP_042902768.1 uncharacterized protein LOC107453449 [Parasteatoda tepidariorum]XP_042902769.1 uncharacterized protein LOC107453449 [Parasteatoda tepidariorum]